MKQVCHIIQQPQLLISKVFKSSNLQATWIKSTKHNISPGRRGLLVASQTLRQNCVWKVGNGTSIRAASQAWVLGKIPTFRDGTPLREVAHTLVADLLLPNHQGWNVSKIYNIFIPSDARLILSMELPYRPDVQDKYYWPLTRSGNYLQIQATTFYCYNNEISIA